MSCVWLGLAEILGWPRFGVVVVVSGCGVVGLAQKTKLKSLTAISSSINHLIAKDIVINASPFQINVDHSRQQTGQSQKI